MTEVSGIEIVRHINEMRTCVQSWRQAGKTVGLVPTMGALHDGHLALAQAARQECDYVITTIFVNPTQFAPHEDFGTYPREERADVKKLDAEGVDLVFAPDVNEMYADGFSTAVSVSGITDCLCGASRPHFFGGVATIVSKLLLQALPDRAYFGEKDFQQLQVIRRMVTDLNIPVEIQGVPIVREADGLAMSSRNKYLSETERKIAPVLYQTLSQLAVDFHAGKPASAILAAAIADLEKAGFDPVDYLEIRDRDTFKPLETNNGAARIFVAAFLGKTRLIDNIAVD